MQSPIEEREVRNKLKGEGDDEGEWLVAALGKSALRVRKQRILFLVRIKS